MEHKSMDLVKEKLRKKLARDWSKVCKIPLAKKELREKYNAIKLLLK